MEQTTEDILRKVRELEIKSKKLATHFFTGEFHSAFKGKGMRFREVRDYTAGDDVRFIDWNVSARFSHPFTKVFEEERELSVMLLIDISTSNLFGTRMRSKREAINEVAAMLAFNVIKNNDKVGAVLFGNEVELYIPPKKGRMHVLYLVRELLSREPCCAGTNIYDAIRYFNRNIKQRSIAFVISDFVGEGYFHDLKVIGKKHDVIGIKISDPADEDLPKVGLLELMDSETGELRWVNTNNAAVRYNYRLHFLKNQEECKQAFRKAGAELLEVRTNDDYIKILQHFFQKRK